MLKNIWSLLKSRGWCPLPLRQQSCLPFSLCCDVTWSQWSEAGTTHTSGFSCDSSLVYCLQPPWTWGFESPGPDGSLAWLEHNPAPVPERGLQLRLEQDWVKSLYVSKPIPSSLSQGFFYGTQLVFLSIAKLIAHYKPACTVTLWFCTCAIILSDTAKGDCFLLPV